MQPEIQGDPTERQRARQRRAEQIQRRRMALGISVLALLVLVLVLVIACPGGEDSAATTTTEPEGSTDITLYLPPILRNSQEQSQSHRWIPPLRPL